MSDVSAELTRALLCTSARKRLCVVRKQVTNFGTFAANTRVYVMSGSNDDGHHRHVEPRRNWIEGLPTKQNHFSRPPRRRCLSVCPRGKGDASAGRAELAAAGLHPNGSTKVCNGQRAAGGGERSKLRSEGTQRVCHAEGVHVRRCRGNLSWFLQSGAPTHRRAE